ncbi:23S rRNA (guanosine(2251)-2'-O)-methyltransferase RlmB [Aestuariirhabdus litorea]|uniref:23S rRNA (guanosine-2'-O-)-methyltransferase RlmB n=1 Tax=Aestuariirhabdus litorea TaxID=2528527 RepID=A0A3P3VIX1_9GAMM|nr:23S rRNA (guanosine(2251)-2'-O)-methyltransferase RlmB [Aestuariirhabdus litorea]RRJ82307.1 23S rRNA (guanosine(2251)-2'-O)-methyltransferase RlmB [Aestuariirhabdus litorea]RWW92472.1 23S rRNA (guanosine(2251)-2'-O)-methyltransferase RlmB [Endozoicomonadaceae bacterium GTF-13]
MSSEISFGVHAVASLLDNHPDQVQELILQRGKRGGRIDELLMRAEAAGIRIGYKDKRWMDEHLEGVHQGVAARVAMLRAGNEGSLEQLLEGLEVPPLLLILDGVTDPHNLGACLRSADAAGVHAVIAPKDRSAPLNATVRKVACGAAEVIPYIAVTNLARTMKGLQQRGIWITGTAGEATESLFQLDLTGPLAVVMGAEGKGMRRLTREHCDRLAYLPMAGEVSSLNVSVATGICLFEAVRQRQAPGGVA